MDHATLALRFKGSGTLPTHAPSCPARGAAQDGTFAWDVAAQPVLSNVSLTARPGSLVMLVGEVGCGKSSLLAALLSELKLRGGSVKVAGAHLTCMASPGLACSAGSKSSPLAALWGGFGPSSSAGPGREVAVHDRPVRRAAGLRPLSGWPQRV